MRDMLPQKFLPTGGIPLSPVYSHTRASGSLDLAHLPERQRPCPKFPLDLPDDLLLALHEQPEEVLHEVCLIAAIHYLQEKRLSLGQAARLAGVSRQDFLDLLAARGIPAFDLSAADAVAEIAAAQRITTDDRQ
jgi:predicted HTH domain antitoxin